MKRIMDNYRNRVFWIACDKAKIRRRRFHDCRHTFATILIMVNARGRRFVDEGADFRNYTYAKYGREILSQPGGVAFQLFDATTRPLLRVEEYAMCALSKRTRWQVQRLSAQASPDFRRSQAHEGLIVGV